jgi:hypothetical protein
MKTPNSKLQTPEKLQAPSPKYSVICVKGDRSESVVASGLEWGIARETAARLDQEFRQRIEAAGKHYSAWTADLHHCRREENQ